MRIPRWKVEEMKSNALMKGLQILLMFEYEMCVIMLNVAYLFTELLIAACFMLHIAFLFVSNCAYCPNSIPNISWCTNCGIAGCLVVTIIKI